MSSATFTACPSADRIASSPSRAWRSRSTTRILSDMSSPLVSPAATRVPECSDSHDEGQVVESAGPADAGDSLIEAHRAKTTSYDLPVALLGRAGDVVGQRASLAGEIRRALIVPLIQGAPGL